MKITGIHKKRHVYADYGYVPLVLAAPFLAGFENNKEAAIICRAFAISALGYSLCTKAKWGVLKLIPYKTHAALDLASGLLALTMTALPAVRKEKAARNTFIAMCITGVAVGTLSLIGASKKKYRH